MPHKTMVWFRRKMLLGSVENSIARIRVLRTREKKQREMRSQGSLDVVDRFYGSYALSEYTEDREFGSTLIR